MQQKKIPMRKCVGCGLYSGRRGGVIKPMAKKIPLRQCVGCGEMKPKKELVRIVKSPEGEISVDLTGKKSGRGAYVCRSGLCLAAAKKAGRLSKAFECAVSPEVYDRLAEEIADG